MNLTWQIVKKDFRRFWLPLALWCLVAVLRFGIGLRLLAANGDAGGWFGRVATYANVLLGIGFLVTYLLVAAVIQEDALVGTSQFWRTRPISGSRLLGAKLLGIGLMLGLLPVLVTLPWWLWCGFSWPEVGGAAAELICLQVCVVLFALPWAVVTDQFGRFLLWSLLAVIAAVSAAMILLEQYDVDGSQIISKWVWDTRLLIMVLIAGAGSAVVAVHQFATRRAVRSIALIAITLVLMLVVGWSWPWEGSSVWALQPRSPVGPAKDITLSFRGASIYNRPPKSWDFVGGAGLDAESVPANYVLAKVYSEQRLRLPGGLATKQSRYDVWNWRSTWAGPAFGLLGVSLGPRDENWINYMMRRKVLPISFWDAYWDSPNPGPVHRESLYESLVIPASWEKRIRTELPAYEASFWFQLLRPEIIGEKPIQAGNVLEKGSKYARIASVDLDEGEHTMKMALVERSPEFMWHVVRYILELGPWPREPVYCAINRARSGVSDERPVTDEGALISDVRIVHRKIAFGDSGEWDKAAHRFEHKPNWFDGATLASIDYIEVEQFSLSVKEEHIRIGLPVGARAMAALDNGTCTVSGAVANPGTFQLRSGMLIMVLRAAGGFTDSADMKAVTITRTGPDGKVHEIAVNMDGYLRDKVGSDTLPNLMPGDVVDVPTEKPN